MKKLMLVALLSVMYVGAMHSWFGRRGGRCNTGCASVCATTFGASSVANVSGEAVAPVCLKDIRVPRTVYDIKQVQVPALKRVTKQPSLRISTPQPPVRYEVPQPPLVIQQPNKVCYKAVPDKITFQAQPDIISYECPAGTRQADSCAAPALSCATTCDTGCSTEIVTSDCGC